jgi:hypothetical protein
MSTPCLPFTTFLNHADDIPQIVVHLHTRLTHTLNRLAYHITMFYNSILLTLTAMQVLAQDQYISDTPSDNTTAVEDTTVDPSPTTAPYAPIESDGEATDVGASDGGYTSNVTDPSATGISGVSDNGDGAASSAGTSNYTTEYYSAPRLLLRAVTPPITPPLLPAMRAVNPNTHLIQALFRPGLNPRPPPSHQQIHLFTCISSLKKIQLNV